jgi:serine protease Do
MCLPNRSRMILVLAACCAAANPLSAQAPPLAPVGPPDPPPASLEPLAELESRLEALIERLSPAVVAIRADRGAEATRDGEAATAGLSAGSGFVLRADGMILTSHHVVDRARSILVTLPDGRRLAARLHAQDPRSDLAVLKVDAGALAALPLHEGPTPARGRLVVAMGHPLGPLATPLASASLGLVSAVGQPLPESLEEDADRYFGDMILTTAIVQPGHSGGPIVDLRGNVVGVITAARGPTDGPAFAVPIDERARGIIRRLLDGRRIEYGYVGAQVAPRALAGHASRGVVVQQVDAAGPAGRAGVRAGDVILSVDGTAIGAPDDFIRRVGALTPGDAVHFELQRGTTRLTIDMRLDARSEALPRSAPGRPFAFRGATFSPIPREFQRSAGLPARALLVVAVADSSPADRAGLSPGDVVLSVEGQAVDGDVEGRLATSADDVLLGLSSGGSVLVTAAAPPD